jgi:hypothetical protein
VVRRSLLVATLSVLGCRQPSGGSGARPTPVDDAPTQDQLFSEQQRIAAGEDVGAPLRAPRIVVDADALTHNGERLLARAALPPTVLRIEPLHAKLRRAREHWLSLYPGGQLVGTPEVVVDVDVDARTLAALLKTVAAAGYLAPTLRVGSTTLALRWNDYASPALQDVRVTVLSTGYEVRFEGGACTPGRRAPGGRPGRAPRRAGGRAPLSRPRGGLRGHLRPRRPAGRLAAGGGRRGHLAAGLDRRRGHR